MLQLYLQGKKEKNDGILLLNLQDNKPNDLVDRFYGPGSLVSRFILDFFKGLEIGQTRSLVGKDVSDKIEGFKNEYHNIEQSEERVGWKNIDSELNLRELSRIVSWATEKSLVEGRNLIASRILLKEQFNQSYIGRARSHSKLVCGGFGSIDTVTIDGFNKDSISYNGTIVWSDLMEGSGGYDRWFAHRLPEGVNMNDYNGLYIYPEKRNLLSGGYHFTIASDFNKAFEEEIATVIDSFNKSKSLASTTN